MKVLQFCRKRPLFTTLVTLVLALTMYLCFVLTSAYLKAPKIVAQAQASGKLPLKLDDFSVRQQNVLLTVEDPDFYAHNGIDLHTPGAGYTTITQSLVKAYFFDGFSPGWLRQRKIKQTLIAWVFNRRVAKATQLWLFVNSVYLGQHNGQEVNGFQQGARAYFNKEFAALSEDEYLSLVATIIAPNELNIAASPAKNRERVNRIRRLLSGTCRPVAVADVYYQQCAGAAERGV